MSILIMKIELTYEQLKRLYNIAVTFGEMPNTESLSMDESIESILADKLIEEIQKRKKEN